MQSSYAAPDAGPAISVSPAFVAVCLFWLLGLAVSIAVIPHSPAEDFSWILAHLE